MIKILIAIVLMFTFGSGLAQSLPEKQDLWIFIMAGQSNMAGRGKVEAQDTIANPRIWTINKEMKWTLAKEPLHFYEPKMVGLDCGLSFGNELLKYIPADVSIALIPCAIGGSSVEQWLGDSTHREVRLLSNFTEKVEFAKQYGMLKGMIWHQGESNANPISLPSYPERLKSLFDKFYSITDVPDLPIVIGELGAFRRPKSKAKNRKMINKKLHDIAKSGKNIKIIRTKDLEHKGDFVHFGSESLREMGKRYAWLQAELILSHRIK